MKAVTFQGIKDVRVKDVPDPKIEKKDDIIVKITSSAICGSDLHLIHGMIPNFPEDYIIGHEPLGIVEETGPDVTKVKKGDRVIIPFTAACGECWYCTHDLESQCDNANANGEMGGYFGYSHLTGGYPGGGRRNICASRMRTLHHLKFRKTAKSKMKNSCCFQMPLPLRSGRWTMRV